MHFARPSQIGLWLLAICLVAQSAAAITIQIDYTYDTSSFFGGGNPQGAAAGIQARSALEAAADYYSTILTDTFDAITIPAPYHSNFPGSTSTKTWSWQARFQHPSITSPNEVQVTNPIIGADQYVVYVGARSLETGTAGRGGPGNWFRPAPAESGSGGYTNADGNNITAITASFDQLIGKRGEANGFAGWGGVISFDNDGSTPWFFNYLGTPTGNVTDFYSVALHELGHTLGFGVSTQWTNLVENSKFVGLNAENQFGGLAIPVAAAPNQGHWDYGTNSVVYGGATAQEALMDPDVQNGTRKKVTALDAAALQDIGWSLGPAPSAPAVNGDYNGNGVVDAADYAVWRKRLNQSVTLPNDTTPGIVTAADYGVWRSNFGKVASGSGSGALLAGGEVPEPATGLLAAMSTLCLYFIRCARRR
jgi:hypothetical protein